MKRPSIVRWLGVLLVLCLAAGARGQDAVSQVNAAASSFQALAAQGMQATFTGQGKFAGHILQMKLTNPTGEPMVLKMQPGMILVPEDKSSQRMIVESAGDKNAPITIPPGGSVEVSIRGYCLDSDKLPPGANRVMSYAVLQDVTPFREAVLTVLAGLELSAGDQYGHEFLPVLQRTIVVQRALWTQEPDPYTQDDLYMELQKEMANTNFSQAAHAGDPEKLAQAIWRDVQLTLKALHQ